FENLSHDPDNAYFVEGIEAEILTRYPRLPISRLSRAPPLSVTRARRKTYPKLDDNLARPKSWKEVFKKAPTQYELTSSLLRLRTIRMFGLTPWIANSSISSWLKRKSRSRSLINCGQNFPARRNNLLLPRRRKILRRTIPICAA